MLSVVSLVSGAHLTDWAVACQVASRLGWNLVPLDLSAYGVPDSPAYGPGALIQTARSSRAFNLLRTLLCLLHRVNPSACPAYRLSRECRTCTVVRLT